MSEIEMFHVGENDKGEELYNLRYVKGGRSLPTPSMTKAEALAKINGEPEQEKSYKDMTKKELELFMREQGIELDRRKNKDDLLDEVDKFFEV